MFLSPEIGGACRNTIHKPRHFRQPPVLLHVNSPVDMEEAVVKGLVFFVCALRV